MTAISTITISDKNYSVVPGSRGMFWSKVQNGSWEPELLQVIAALLDRSWHYYDVGAWIGPTLLYASTFGCKCIGFEPDPEALRQLKRNLAQNPLLASRIELHEAAAGCEDGEIVLHSAVLGNSETSIYANHQRADGIRHCEVSLRAPMLDLRQVVSLHTPAAQKNFFKIDAEGAEFMFLAEIAPFLAGIPCVIAASLHPGNIVLDSPEQSAARRYREKARIMDAFSGFHWSTFDGSAFVAVDKLQTMRKLMQTADASNLPILSTFPLA